MFVKGIELRNIRSYKKQKLDFSKGINLIIGANNSGKTTILKSIYTLQSNTAIQQSDIRKTESYCKIKIELEDINEEEKKLFYNHKVQKSCPANSAKQTVCIGLGEAVESIVNESVFFNSNLKNETDENGKISIYDDSMKVIDFNEFPRFTNNESENNFIYPFFAKRKTNYFSSHGRGDSANLVNDDLSNLPSKVLRIGASAHPRFKEFQMHCLDILGFDISALSADTDNEGHKIGTYATARHKIFLESMGEGVVNILGLITILLTENNKLFLIEELENDIHPLALKKLLNLIATKSNSNQFIISTHSNIVVKYLAALPDSKLFHTNWKNSDDTTSTNLRVPTSTVSEPINIPENRIKILESLGYDLFDFDLFSSYLIFEESSAERIVRDILIPMFFPTLTGKIRTIAAKGADDLEPKFNDFHRLFIYVHINPIYTRKAWVLADGDSAGKKNIQKLKDKFKTWPSEHFLNFSKDNFEEFYPVKFKSAVKRIFEITDKEKRQEEKQKLTLNVVEWAIKNKELAKKQFAVSAKEVINILQEINKQVNHK